MKENERRKLRWILCDEIADKNGKPVFLNYRCPVCGEYRVEKEKYCKKCGVYLYG